MAVHAAKDVNAFQPPWVPSKALTCMYPRLQLLPHEHPSAHSCSARRSYLTSRSDRADMLHWAVMQQSGGLHAYSCMRLCICKTHCGPQMWPSSCLQTPATDPPVAQNLQHRLALPCATSLSLAVPIPACCSACSAAPSIARPPALHSTLQRAPRVLSSKLSKPGELRRRCRRARAHP